mgnify:FL=1
MEEKWTDRTESLIGKDSVEKLSNAKIIVYGIGGVGSFAVEALARAGVGHLILVDIDTISISNINRQIHSTIKTIGKSKVETMKNRVLEINPDLKVEIYNPKDMNIQEENLIDNKCDYVIDAVDTISTKIKIIQKANDLGVPIISAMGTGNKLDPTKFEVSDIYKTSVCPLAKVMRKELKKAGIKKLKVVYSKEEPKLRGKIPASISFMPSVCGLIMAGEVIKDIINS